MNKPVRRLRIPGKGKETLMAWLIMLPGIILFAFFLWGPLLESMRMSLYSTRNVELVEFVWFDNFISVFNKADFIQALINTFSYTFWSLLIGFFLPIFIALLIGETARSKGFFRTAAYIPNILPGLAVIILWTAFFSAEKSGVVNILLGKLGIAPMAYLSHSGYVIPIIILVALDGAGIFKRIRHITFPAIFNLGSTLLILQIISIFQIMYEPMVLTRGGPDNASLSLMLLMWRYAFGGSMDFGKASAVAVIITLILLVFTAVYFVVNRRKTEWE
ncbi:MAG: Lactose transport system permease protein LacF [Firmicutes bacterium ADurb.Bin182]|nr:MAG: Lactose transport system permease protein LacF [Firmicutes bacterium ADurb.Bin182]